MLNANTMTLAFCVFIIWLVVLSVIMRDYVKFCLQYSAVCLWYENVTVARPIYSSAVVMMSK